MISGLIQTKNILEIKLLYKDIILDDKLNLLDANVESLVDKKPITNEKDKGNQINKIKKNIKINPIKFKINENDDIAQKI